MKRINNVFDYLAWRGDLTFAQASFNELDGLILSKLSYLAYASASKESVENVLLDDALKNYFEEHKGKKLSLGAIIPKAIFDLAKEVLRSKRYDNLELLRIKSEIDKELQEQFVAIAIRQDENILIIYQGTDDSIIGWQEDFNMIKQNPIPSQSASLAFLEEIADAYPNAPFYLMGHSKGGNLAHYASIFANSDIKKRIIKAFSFDGPGFEYEFIGDKALDVQNKLVTFSPDHSIVSLIFHQVGRVRYIKSTNRTIYQHDGFSWQVMGAKFERSSNTKDTLAFNEEFNNYLASLSAEEKDKIVASSKIFFASLKVSTLTEASENIFDIFASLRNIPKDARVFINKIISIMVKHHML